MVFLVYSIPEHKVLTSYSNFISDLINLAAICKNEFPGGAEFLIVLVQNTCVLFTELPAVSSP